MVGTVIGVVLIALGILLWPGLFGQLVPLDWMEGDMRTPCGVVSLALILAGIVALVRREQLQEAWRRRFPTRRSLAIRFTALVFWLIVGFAVTEIGMRLANLPLTRHRAPSDKALAQFDADLGWSYIPSQSATRAYGTAGREVSMHFDAIGARVASPDVQHDPEAPTLILVGGSLTMGHGVEYEESLAGQLEATPGFELQIVNLAIQGQGTDQAYLQLRRHIEAFNVKAVVYGYFCDHLRRNSVPDRHLLRPNLWYVGTKPMFAVDSAGVLTQVAFPQRFDELSYWRWGALLHVLWIRHGPAPTFDVTRGLVAGMRDLTQARGGTFILLDWVIGPPEDFCEGERFDGLGLHIVDTMTDAPADWFDWRIPGDGHPQPRGHTRVAALVFQELRRLGLVAEATPDSGAHLAPR